MRVEGATECVRVPFCTVLVCGLSWESAAAQSPSFDCTKARLPDEIAICRTPELAELDDVIAAAYAYLKSTQGGPTRTILEFRFGG